MADLPPLAMLAIVPVALLVVYTAWETALYFLTPTVGKKGKR